MAYHGGYNGWYIQPYFYETIISIRSSISELVSVYIFKLSDQEACNDGHTDIIIVILCTAVYLFYKYSIFY